MDHSPFPLLDSFSSQALTGEDEDEDEDASSGLRNTSGRAALARGHRAHTLATRMYITLSSNFTHNTVDAL